MSLPTTRRGLFKTAQFKTLITDQPFPKLRDNHILIKTVAVALNPADWQTVEESFTPGTPPALLGCDISGIVVAIGKGVTKSWNIGDRVASCVHGANEVEPQDGAFADYALLNGELAIRIPESLSFEEAATLGGAVVTTALSLYSPKFMNLPLPPSERTAGEEQKFILIYGGSTAMGTMGIQFAKLSGYTVITTSSPRNFALLKGYGADYTLDYNEPNCGPSIRNLTKNKLTLVYDTIAIPSSAQICAEALSSTPETPLLYINLMGLTNPHPDVESKFPLGYTIEGKRFIFNGEEWPAMPEDFELGKKFVALTEELLKAKAIKTHPVDLREGGIDGILSGMQDLKDGKVSGAKLVYRIGG